MYVGETQQAVYVQPRGTNNPYYKVMTNNHFILPDHSILSMTVCITEDEGYSYGVQRHFQQYFTYIVTVSFIGGGNRNTRRNPCTYLLQVTAKLYHMRIELTSSEQNSNSQL